MLAAAPDADAGGSRLKRRLVGRITKTHGLVDVARGAPAKKQRAKLRRANKLLAAFIHSVQKGDTLFKIAHELSTSVSKLCRVNNLAAGSPLIPGMLLSVER